MFEQCFDIAALHTGECVIQVAQQFVFKILWKVFHSHKVNAS